MAPVFGAVGAFALSYAQRSLSTPARMLRRRVTDVRGAMTLTDGTVRRVDDQLLRVPLERALRALSWGVMALAAAFAVARLR